MKTLSQIKKSLNSFEDIFKLKLTSAPQGSQEWLTLKLGVISASNASKAVAKKDSETRNTYMSELIAQICTGDQEEINSKYLDWGKAHEAAARSCYEFSTNETITEVPFVFKDATFREGCSPDGILSTGKPVEIKCPYNAVHYIKFLTDDKIKPEYQWQYQYTLRVLGANEMDFVQYHPNMKTNPQKILTVVRDDKMQSQMDEMIPSFIEDMDKMLDKIGVQFGDQWKRLAIK